MQSGAVPATANRPNANAPLAPNADISQPLHASSSSPPLLAEHAPASLATSDGIEDAVAAALQHRQAETSSPALQKKASSPWPSACEMAPEDLKEYLTSLEIPKPKPRPRRKHLDRKMELAKLKQQLVDLLAYRTQLLQLNEASSAPPDIQGATDRILRVHGLPNALDDEDNMSGHVLRQPPPSSRQVGRSASAPSISSATSVDAQSTAPDYPDAEAIEEEILTMNEEIQKLMLSINELDKIKDPQIELSFTGPKQKNMQRARPDDDLWTEHTGRAPGIVSDLSSPRPSSHLIKQCIVPSSGASQASVQPMILSGPS